MNKTSTRWRSGIRAAELVAVAGAVGLLGWFGWVYGGQVKGSDMLLYIDVGLRGLEDPFILNRYAHVYALRIFTFISSTPIEGMRLYSAFATGIGAFLVYLSARYLSSASGAINGVIAVVMLLSLSRIVDRLIAPAVDTTAMLMVLAAVAIYLQSVRRKHSSRILLILFGAVFLLALRSKETTIVIAVVLPGFGMQSGGAFTLRQFTKNLKYLAVGFVVGIVITVMMNALVLSSPLFGFRLSDIAAYREQWAATLGSASRAGETFSTLLIAETGVLFALYIASGVAEGKQMRLSSKLLWTFPLVLLTMLILFTTRTGWSIVPRGFLPGLAIISILAGQAVRLAELRPMGLARLGRIGLLPIALVALLALIGITTKGDLPFHTYFQAAMAPILLSATLILLFLFGRRPEIHAAIVLLLLPLLLYPASRNLLKLVAEPMVAKPNYRFEPIVAFQEQISDSDELNMFVSDELLPYLSINDNRDELSTLVNIALDLRTGRGDYKIGARDQALIENLERGSYTHVLLISDEWDWLRSAPQDDPNWRAQYTSTTEPSGRFVLLSKANSSASHH